MRRHRLDAIHARNHVPAAMALIVKRLTGCRMIFDLRGLMAEEYVDAGNWKRGGLPYRLTQWVQSVAIRRADAMVMLTEAVRRQLFGAGADGAAALGDPLLRGPGELQRRRGRRGDRAGGARRGRAAHAGLRRASSPAGTWSARWSTSSRRPAQLVPDLLFVVLTQSDRAIIEREFARVGHRERRTTA